MVDLAQPTCRYAAAPKPLSDELPLDSEILLSYCMNNRSLALTLVKEFQRSGGEQVNRIVKSAMAGDSLEAAESAHSLKGASAIMGARGLNALACRIEATGGGSDAELVLELAMQLRREMDRCLSYLTRLGAELGRADCPDHVLPVRDPKLDQCTFRKPIDRSESSRETRGVTSCGVAESFGHSKRIRYANPAV